jgi:Putative Ig domain
MMEIGGDPPPGMVGDYYWTLLTAIGTAGPSQWTITGDVALPPGLVLDSHEGTISGTPERQAKSRTTVTVNLNDGSGSVTRRFTLEINPALEISAAFPAPSGAPNSIGKLQATGGAPPYTWELVSGYELPGNVTLDPSGDIRGVPETSGRTRFRVLARDHDDHTATADFSISAHQANRTSRSAINRISVIVRPPSWLRQRLDQLRNLSNWLFALLGLGVPVISLLLIIIYAFGTKGPHLSYIGTGLLAGLAAFLSGCLAGFLFGVPRAISSGQLRQQKDTPAPAYTPSSNLAEVSDWLTKLLLGAGLVQLTHLGAPIGSLIDHVAAGLHGPLGDKAAAEVAAGALLFGLAFAGILDGYIGTTMWYQKHIANL